jgi:hypothetical protein
MAISISWGVSPMTDKKLLFLSESDKKIYLHDDKDAIEGPLGSLLIQGVYWKETVCK